MTLETKNAKIYEGAVLVCIIAFMACTQKEQAPKNTIVNVKTMKVTSSSHVMGKNYMGTIEEEDGANVSFGVVGTVVKVMVDEGQFVRKGQAMAEVDARDHANLEKALKLGDQWRESGYHVISMKDDFKTIYGDGVVKTDFSF